MGKNFSGGQLQRIGLARALYKDPEILILDEATNALDIETERKIFENLKKIENITIIMVSHNHKNLEFCNKVFELNNGSVILKKS